MEASDPRQLLVLGQMLIGLSFIRQFMIADKLLLEDLVNSVALARCPQPIGRSMLSAD